MNKLELEKNLKIKIFQVANVTFGHTVNLQQRKTTKAFQQYDL